MKIIVLFLSFVFILFANEDIEIVEDFNTNNNNNIEVVQNVPVIETEKIQTDVNIDSTYKKNIDIPIKEQRQKKKVYKKSIVKNLSFTEQNKSMQQKSIARKNIKKTIIKEKKKYKKLSKKKPKLVIIIDDISHKWQLQKIKSLGLKITPSIFPPNRMNMKSNLLAKGLKHFMVHLPLESHSKKMNRFYKTLFVSDSKKKIEQRVREIRKLFPNAKYINNHTGSLFSENYKASKQLYDILKKEGFIFVDSKTSYHSKFKKIAKREHRHYLHSDIFIDDTQSVQYSYKMIKRAIAIAKRKGKAILIGHPHPTTFAALKKAKALLQRDVEVVYIDELY